MYCFLNTQENNKTNLKWKYKDKKSTRQTAEYHQNYSQN